MKKHTIIESIGKWENTKNGRITHCTVLETRLYAESNDYIEMFNNVPKTEYRKDGTWHSYSYAPRKDAKKRISH